MATTAFKGESVTVSGSLPADGIKAPPFELAGTDLSDVSLASLAGKTVVLNVFPSVDTSVCAASVRRFNEAAAGLKDVVVLCVSRDLPFALGRFCGAEGIENVQPLSDFRTGAFGRDYGVEIADGPLRGLLARAIVVIGADGVVAYSALNGEIAEEPDYAAAMEALA